MDRLTDTKSTRTLDQQPIIYNSIMTNLSDIEEVSCEESKTTVDKDDTIKDHLSRAEGDDIEAAFEDVSREVANVITIESVVDNERSGTLSNERSAAMSLRTSCRTSRSASMVMSIISPLYRQLAATRREESSERKSGLCCGSCCDLVRGCIVANMLNICLTIWYLVFSLQGIQRIWIGVVTDDDLYAPQSMFERPSVLGLVRTSFGIPFALIGMFGAHRFQKYAVLCTAIWYCIDIVPGVLNKAWPNAVISAFFCYPHVHLFLELRNGTITPENYNTTERYCCYKFCVGGNKNENRGSWQTPSRDLQNTPSRDLSCASAVS